MNFDPAGQSNLPTDRGSALLTDEKSTSTVIEIEKSKCNLHLHLFDRRSFPRFKFAIRQVSFLM